MHALLSDTIRDRLEFSLDKAEIPCRDLKQTRPAIRPI